jgi:hypothetical protein
MIHRENKDGTCYWFRSCEDPRNAQHLRGASFGPVVEHPILQCEAPKKAKLVYNSNNYCL